MPIYVDIKGYEMVGEDSVSGDSLRRYSPSEDFKPKNPYPVGAYAGGYNLCVVMWLDDKDLKQRKAIIMVKPKEEDCHVTSQD